MKILSNSLLLIALASSASAQTYFAWGNPVPGFESETSKPSDVIISATDDGDHVATILAANYLNGGTSDIVIARLVLNGVPFSVRIEQHDGGLPDNYSVTVPEGFIAIPQSVDIPEGGEAEIKIYALGKMLMG